MKKSLSILVVIVIIAFGLFRYFTRPPSAPTQSIQSVTDSSAVSTASSTVYRISQDVSEAQFEIDEMLYGKPKHVVGTTNQIAGDITVSGSVIAVGTLKLDARTWRTDSDDRDGALDRLILKAEKPANEYMTFVPTSTDFAGTVTTGQNLVFNVTGDMTISGVTKPVTFKVTAVVSADKITGTATTVIKRSDFGLTIPNFSFLANVGDEVTVKSSVTANRVGN